MSEALLELCSWLSLCLYLLLSSSGFCCSHTVPLLVLNQGAFSTQCMYNSLCLSSHECVSSFLTCHKILIRMSLPVKPYIATLSKILSLLTNIFSRSPSYRIIIFPPLEKKLRETSLLLSFVCCCNPFTRTVPNT